MSGHLTEQGNIVQRRLVRSPDGEVIIELAVFQNNVILTIAEGHVSGYIEWFLIVDLLDNVFIT